MSAPAAPFPRPLYPSADKRRSTPGVDVVAYKRALWRLGLLEQLPGGFDERYNRRTVEAVRTFQRDVGIDPTGNLGFATFEALRTAKPAEHPGEYAFDQIAVSLLERAAKVHALTPTQKAQHAGVDAANYWILHRDQSDYAQIRPFPVIKPPAIARKVDCSGFVTEVYYAAGAPDPNGRGYDGQGYTGTLVQHGRLVQRPDLQPLDLVFYGFTTHPTPAFPWGSPTHVTVYIGGGYVASDGSQSGPEKRTLDYRGAAPASSQNPMGVNQARRYPLA